MTSPGSFHERLARVWPRIALVLALMGVAVPAQAETLAAPIGGQPIPLGERVACGAPTGGWSLVPGSRAVRPPFSEAAVGKSVDLAVAADAAACAKNRTSVTLAATARFPNIDAASVVLTADHARVEARGHRLKGVALRWRSPSASGVDVCLDPKATDAGERCTWTVGRDLGANPPSGALGWLPAGTPLGADVKLFDPDGTLAETATTEVVPAKIVIGSLVQPDAAIDLSEGSSAVPLTHPEAVVGVDCAPVRCEVANGRVVVRTLARDITSVNVKFKLLPRVILQKEGAPEAEPLVRLPVRHCPMTVVSGPVLAGVADARVVVAAERGCGQDVSAFLFRVNDRTARLVTTEVDGQRTAFVVEIGNVTGPSVLLTATMQADPELIVAATEVPVAPAPQVRSTLSIPGYKNLGFIPSNRPATIHLPKLPNSARLVPVSVDGVYQAVGVDRVIGDEFAAGLTALRFGYRVSTLPGRLKDTDLGTLVDPLQRSIHEANVPAPLAIQPGALVEVLCGAPGHARVVIPGRPTRLPFSQRDGCRMVLHRERLRKIYGTQKLTLNIEITDLDGVARSKGRVSQTIVLRPGTLPLTAWIGGVVSAFDRAVVSIAHAPDEAHYVDAAEMATGAPEVQWTILFGTSRARWYATTTIPTGLYRFGGESSSGVLSLNFGIISRFTWLDSEGHEGFLGLETGVMAIGLTNDKSATGESLTQVGLVGGIGFAVPIANRSTPTQASINLHGWVEKGLTGDQSLAFIVGPSISIGNVGANL